MNNLICKTIKLIVALLCFGIVLFGCRKIFHNGIEVSIETDKTKYSLSDTVYFKLTVTNNSTDTIHLFAPERAVIDVLIFHNDNEIWHWKKGGYPDPWYYDLAPCERLKFEYMELFWLQVDNNDSLVPRGKYEVVGILTTDPEYRSRSITIELK